MKQFIFIAMLFIIQAITQHANAQTRWKYDFIVPRDGTFIQAIHAANNRPDKSKRFRIFIHSSMYRQRGEGNMIKVNSNGKTIEVPSPMTVLTAPNTSIIGEGMRHTQIETEPQYEGYDCTASLFLNRADSTYIQDIELYSNFRNAWDAHAYRCVALNEKNCKGNIFKNLSLLSAKGTYYTNDGGTTYLEDCEIKGTEDFIIGGGTIYFNQCNIGLRPRGETGAPDVICAPSTEAFRQYGYIFNNCRISGSKEQAGHYTLGRPWKNAPQAVFISTIMELAPHPAGWQETTTLPRLFSEYESLDNEFQLVSTQERRKQFKNENNVTTTMRYNTELSLEEASQYDIDNVFPGWHPDRQAAQVEPPILKIQNRNQLIWEDIPEACCYAICKNRDVVTFTTEPTYTIPKGTADGSIYTIRCANFHGGLGLRSNDVTYTIR